MSNLHPENEKVKQSRAQSEKFYYGRISEQVVSSGIWAKLSKKAPKVYIAALSHARDQNKNWEVWPSNETLAKESGIHEKLIPAARREIEAAGLIAQKWRVDRQIHYEFAGAGFAAVETTHHITTKRPRDHYGRFTTAENATLAKSTTYGEPVPQSMEAAVPQNMDTKDTLERIQMKETLSLTPECSRESES